MSAHHYNFNGEPYRRLLQGYGFIFDTPRTRHLSAAGDLLGQLEDAEAAVFDETDITDELRCAMRRIQKGQFTP